MRSRIVAVVIAMLGSLFLTPPASSAPPDWLDTGVTKTFPNNDGVKVLDLRFASHASFDRVVIDLRGPLPDHRTSYDKWFNYEGSGSLIPIRGRSGLWVSLTADGHTQSGQNLYRGPRLARPHLDTLKALALGGDFEGQVTFAFALRNRADYRIQHLSNPSRMVIDFRHR